MIKALLQRPIAYHPILAKACGSVKLAVLWSQLYYWSDKGHHPEGWIHKTQEEIFEETGLSRREQENARKLGKELAILEERLMSVPATMHFRVDTDKAMKLIEQYKPAAKKEAPEKAFDMEAEIVKLEESDRRDLNIIAYFIRQKGVRFESYGEYQVALKRYLRAAKDLSAFTDEKIQAGVKKAKAEYPDSWTVETAIKMLTNRK